MNLPKFLIGDSSMVEDTVYVIHLEYPRFVLDVQTDEIEWLEEFSKEDEKELENEAENLIEAAFAFYDQEMSSIEA